MIEIYIRGFIQPLFDKLGLMLIKLKFTPNVLTLMALLTGAFCGIAISQGELILAAGMLCFSGFCDIMDGTVARLSNTVQKIGAYMDTIGDRLVEAAIILGFAYIYPAHGLAYLTFFAAILFNSSTLMIASVLFGSTSPKKELSFEKNIISRSELFLIFGLMLFVPEYIFEMLVGFSLLIIALGIIRFFKVIAYDREVKLARKKKRTSTI